MTAGQPGPPISPAATMNGFYPMQAFKALQANKLNIHLGMQLKSFASI